MTEFNIRITEKNWILVKDSVIGMYDPTNKFIILYSAAKWMIGTNKHMIPCEEREKVLSTMIKEIEECVKPTAP